MPRSAGSVPGIPTNETRSFHHSLYPLERLVAERGERGERGERAVRAERGLAERELSVSVCLPARECSRTVGEIVSELVRLREAGVIDQIVVVDAASSDGTAAVAARAGAEVWQEAELMPEYGPVLGKGDAMWRALSALEGELVCFLDADTEGFSAHFATGLLGPLMCEPGISFVKAFYRRSLLDEGASVADGGGRVNRLMARPALELFYPELAHVRQPLAGEVAARRELLERLPFVTGYGVEIAMLIDAWRDVGLQGIAQVDLDHHHNRHQPLSALTPMALTVLAAIARRLEQEGRLQAVGNDLVERPPLATVGVA
jgi:glucosyl-3-phosphoglycerate synthase